MAKDPYGGDDPTAADCVRAGMYWFSRLDLEAARAWWERARELEPGNAKAAECLELLATYEQQSQEPPRRPPEQKIEPAKRDAPPKETFAAERVLEPSFHSVDLDRTNWTPSRPLPKVERPAPSEKGVWPPPPEPSPFAMPAFDAPPADYQPEDVPDPLDFASMAEPDEHYLSSSSEVSPWDGPSRTSVVTLDPDDEFDAVAEPTPLPAIDRERFFGRIHDDQALVDYIVATGDLLIREAPPLRSSSSPGTQPLDASAFEVVEARPETLSDDLEVPPLGRKVKDEIIFDDPVELTPSPEEIVDRIAVARDRFQLHDFQGVIDAIEEIPPTERTDEATNLLAVSRANLLKMYESKIGPTDRVPRVVLSGEEVIWLALNHRAGFILSQIDGAVTYEDLISLSGMDRLDTVRILAELIQQRVIRSD